MVNLRPYFYLSLTSTLILFSLFIAVGHYGSPSDVFFFAASLFTGGLSYIIFRKDQENKAARRH